MSTVETTPTTSGATVRGAVRENPAVPVRWWARLRLLDAAIVAALTLLTVASLPVLDRMSTLDRESDAVAVVLVLLAAGVTALRGRWPLAAAAAAGALVGAAARHHPLSRSGLLAAAVYLLLLVHLLTNAASFAGPAGLVPALAWVAIPFTVGAARRRVVAVRARERQASERRLVAAERLRLSQEVHDVVGHGLAAIQMQADITLHLSAPRPEQTRAALQAISQASETALEELRSTLSAIHAEGDDAPASRAPTPGLARAGELCRRVQDAGIRVRFDVEGDASTGTEAWSIRNGGVPGSLPVLPRCGYRAARWRSELARAHTT